MTLIYPTSSYCSSSYYSSSYYSQGAGKTQVISPLLALTLADGASLVTVVCPSPLLQQSLSHFRNRFANVLPKNIITLKFERSSAEYSSLAGMTSLLHKLEEARKDRSIVLTTPQAVKSMVLKYIDLLLFIRNIPTKLRIFETNDTSDNSTDNNSYSNTINHNSLNDSNRNSSHRLVAAEMGVDMVTASQHMNDALHGFEDASRMADILG